MSIHLHTKQVVTEWLGVFCWRCFQMSNIIYFGITYNNTYNKQLNNSWHITGFSILSHLSCLNWERGSWGIVTHLISALMWPVSPCLNPCALALSCTSRPSLQYVCVCVCQVTWFCRMTCCNCADADTFNCEGRGRRGAWGGFSQHVHAETLHSFCGWPVY